MIGDDGGGRGRRENGRGGGERVETTEEQNERGRREL